jgi:hypothetical protein
MFYAWAASMSSRRRSAVTALRAPYDAAPHSLSSPYLHDFIFAGSKEERSLNVPSVPEDAISTNGLNSVGQAEADLSASSAFDPPAPSDIFVRLGVMLVVALGFGLSAQCLLAVLQH